MNPIPFLTRISFCLLFALATGRAGNPPPTQLFYVPLPENNQLAGFAGINATAVDPLAIFVTFSAATDNTVIYYDHWEDGYERDITSPTQSTTLVFGDGNPSNGYPPGNPSDLIPAGTVFSLRNYVSSTDLLALDYDARDKVASYKPISLTKTSFPASTNTLLAGCVEVFEQGLWGTEYRIPIGVDMPTSPASATLAEDYDIFSYTALSIMAGEDGATVQIDADNNGAFELTVTLAEGETTYVTDVNVGGRVLSNHPVQVTMFSGRPGSNYQSRDTSLLPIYRWSNTYYAPVTTDNAGNYRTAVFLYNPSASAITVSYDYRNTASSYTTATVSVPARGNARVNLAPAGTGHSGAYRFRTTGATPPTFYAFSAVDAANTSTGQNQAYDGGFTLVGQPSLTTQVLVSLGIGRDPYSATSPTQNGNPVWLTTVGNGHTQATVYVDYNGDNAGANTDPNGNRYDVSYDLRELEQQKIFDPDGDQSGMLVYSLNPAVKIAAAWAQDPLVASTAQPGLDVATLLPPLREGEAGKKSTVAVDADADGYLSAGDTLEYDIRGVNSARAAIPGPFAVTDNLPADVVYVPNTARYRFSVGGAWQAWVAVPDSGSGTPFPLDGSGYSVPGNLGIGQALQVTFRATVKSYGDLSGGKIVNSGSVEISPYGLVLPVEWSDTVYGSIGDRVWQDLDGDGIQEPGENGIPGIEVFADFNNNGAWDAGEPQSTTDANGNYLLKGLAAGTYNVRVDPVDIAAANVGYGTTFDLDGIATSNVAVVTLASAQDRVDADFGYRVGASVGNRVWVDRDGDGVQEGGEPGINGVRVYLDLNNNNAYDAGEPNTITSNDGVYYIGNLNPGTYVARVDTTTLPSGANLTFDLNGVLDHEASVTLISAEHRGDLDFGYRGNLSIGDLVWNDPDANGIRVTYNVIDGRIDINNDAAVNGSDDGTLAGYQIIDGRIDLNGSTTISTADDGTFQGIAVIDGNLDTDGSTAISTADDLSAGVADEAGLSGVRVFIDANGNGTFDSTEANAVTSARGIYSINNLFNGTYTVMVDATTLPTSFVQTYDLTSPATDHKAAVTLSGTSRTDVDFGYRNDATLGDLVWNDRNNNGVRDAGEPGIQGVVVYLDTDADGVFDQGVERFVITDLNGYYLIDNLPADSYPVRVEFSTLPQGSTATYDLDGTGTVHSASRTLATSENAADVDFGYRSTASVGNFVWNDSDADGVQDAGESGINGVRVYLDMNGNGVFDSATEPSSTTNASGAWVIDGLVAGTYTARIDLTTLPAGFIQTFDATGALDHAATFALSANQTRTDIDFGYTQRVVIGDLVWNDANANGQQDVGETGLDGVTVTAYDASNDTIAGTTTTHSSGLYSFNLMPGTYYVVFDTPAGYQRTVPDQGADMTDSDISLAAGRTPNATLTGGQTNNTLDAGYFQPATISDFVWNDANANGQQDSGETGLNGVTVTLYRPGFGPDGIAGNADDAAAVATTTTASGGAYSFTGLRPGTYQVNFGALAGYSRTLADQGADATDSDSDVGTGRTANIVLAAGATNNTIDAGYFQPATISDFVWNDANANGQQDSGETGLNGVTVTLYRPGFGPDGIAGNADDATAVATTTTASGGTYSFTGLRPGTYQVNFGTLAGYSRTLADQGADASDSDANIGTGQTANIVLAPGAANNTIDAGYFQPATISDFVWNDANANGQQDSGETGLNGVTVTLYRPGFGPDGIAGNADDATAVATTTTASGGTYSFTGLRPGTYQVSFGTLAGYSRTIADQGADASDSDANIGTGQTANIVLAAGAANNTIDAGYFQPGSIAGNVLADTDNDDDGDTGIGSVNLTLKDGTGNDIDSDPGTSGVQPTTTTTAPDGSYSFTNLAPGTYRVVETHPSGYLSVTDKDGGNPDQILAISVTPGAANTGNDFIEEQPGSIAGSVLADADNDDDGDAGIGSVTLTLKDSSGNDIDSDPGTSGVQPTTTTTAPDGSYSFTNLAPGTYRVVETHPSGYLSVTDKDGGNPDQILAISVAPGAANTGNDFIEEQPGSIAGAVLIDTNNDGIGEDPLSGVSLTLLDEVGNPVDGDPGVPGVQFVTAVTDNKGNYQFDNLPPGIYGVSESQPVGYLSVSDKDGGDPNRIHPVVVPVGGVSTGNDFIEEQPGSIAGSVLADADNDDDGDNGIGSVNLALKDGTGNDIDSDPGTSGVQPTTTSTAPDGSYSFTNLAPGTYRVVETHPSGYLSVTDKDGGNPDQILAISVAPGAANTGNDFIEEQPGSITGSVLADADNDDDGDTGIGSVNLTLKDGSGNDIDSDPGTSGVQPTTTTTAPDGSYSFINLAPGTYRVVETHPSGYLSVTDKDGGNPDQILAISVAPGAANTGNDFIEEQPGSITGSVLADADNDDDGDTGIGSVNLTLKDGSGNDIDSDPGTSGVQPTTTSTAPDGSYSFTNLAPGTYRVVETHPSGYLSVTDKDGGNPDQILAISVAPGAASTGNNFIEEQPGVIGNYVWMDLDKDGVQNDGATSGVNGVTVQLLDSGGAVTATVTTADDGSGNPGFYSFGGLAPGAYSVRFTPPADTVFTWQTGGLTASDNSDADRSTGTTAQVTLTAGQNAAFIDAGLKCPDTWADWKQLHPGEDAAENLDTDAYDNFAEYAFAMPDNGTGSAYLGGTAWIIRSSGLAPGTLEAVFIRPTGWNTGSGQGAVTYTLQSKASISDPGAWQEVVLTPDKYTVADNGDCTETVTIHDLEARTGLTGGTGVVRIKAEQTDTSGPDPGATTYTEPEGWTETPLEPCCQTYGTPYQRETVFTGTVDAVSGQDLAFTGEDLTNLLMPGVSHYVEVLSGDHAGQRFDVVSTGNGTVTLAADTDILSAAPPFNTLATIPASLAGDLIAIRPHWTLGSLFPIDGLVATNSNTTAEQVQTYAAGAWTTYWLHDMGDAVPATASWVKLAGPGGDVIPPGQGMFFTKRVAAAGMLSYGEIRTNPFVRPLATGAPSNLVAGGYPVDQSPLGREWSTAEGFLGTRDFKTADSIFVWQNDASPPFNSGYDTYWLLNSATPQVLNRWVKQGDASITDRSAAVLLEYDRAVFLRTAADQTTYKVTAPWTP